MAKIGVFDSGYGGLTILKEIRKTLPEYDYIYLGDNARAPYGTHSFDVIYRYTLQAVKYLFEQDCNLIILACNTASAKALRTIQQTYLVERQKTALLKDERSKPVNVLGVIRPTVEAVPEITKTGHVGILATPATVSSESYVLELEKIANESVQELKNESVKELVVTQQACPMWVPLIEAGEHNEPGAKYFIGKYLRELLAKDPQIDTIVLGCTHYPLLINKIRKFCPPTVEIMTQGGYIASSLKDYLTRHPEMDARLGRGGTVQYFTSESPERFSENASIFLSTKIQVNKIQLLNSK